MAILLFLKIHACRLKADKLNTQNYYKRFKGEIDHLRALHKLPKPSPPKEIIPCKLKYVIHIEPP
jgi:hypothetical protein